MSKSAKRVAVNNLYYFDRKTQKLELTYDQVTRASKFITRANDPTKVLGNKPAKTLLTAVVDRIEVSKNGEIFIDHDFISSITDCKPEQNTNILGQLSDILDYQYHRSVIFEGKRKRYGYIINYTADGKKRITNPELFYSIELPQKHLKKTKVSPKKIDVMAEKNRGSYISNKETLREVEEIAYGYISSTEEEVTIKESNNARAQETENTTCSNAILTEHSQVAIPEPKETVLPCGDTNKPKLLTASKEKAIHQERMERTSENTGTSSFAQLMSKVLNEPELPITQEEIPAMKQEEPSIITGKETRKMLLSKAIFDAFGATANEIQDNCKFEETAVGKVTIKPAIGVSFNDIEKAKIRKCIKSVYGEDVVLALVNTNLYVNKEPVATESGSARSEVVETPSQNNPQWLQFKSALTKVLLKKHEEKTALHILKNWFDKLRVSDDTTSQKLILVGSVFTIQWIDDKFGMELENAVLASNLIIELQDEANRNRPLIFSKETIKRGGGEKK